MRGFVSVQRKFAAGLALMLAVTLSGCESFDFSMPAWLKPGPTKPAPLPPVTTPEKPAPPVTVTVAPMPEPQPEPVISNCGPEKINRLRGVEWGFAKVIPVRVRQGEFSPLVIYLRRDMPYVFRFTNADDRAHTFAAPDFFEAVAVSHLPGTSGPEPAAPLPSALVTAATPVPCNDDVSAIKLPADATVELPLVTMRDGRYSFQDVFLYLPSSLTGGDIGVIVIE